VAISAGAHLAGVRSALLMQNHGLLASVNGIVSLAQLYRIPLLLLVSYRGEMGEEHPWQTEGGGVTRPVLDALRVPYVLLREAGHAERRLRQAQALAEAALRPVAVLLTRDLMWED
jgi:sulfopyruvate decarboxylase subunit alpha